MRCFLALRPTAAVRDRLDALGQRLRAWELPGRWTAREDLHLTTLFLGELDEDEARLLPLLVEDALATRVAPPPAWRLTGLGAWGGSQWPKTVYAAVADAGGWLADLHQDLAAACDTAPDAVYRPHLTLVRPQGAGRAGRDWPELLAAHGDMDLGDCAVEELVLYSSGHDDGGPRYRRRDGWAL